MKNIRRYRAASTLLIIILGAAALLAIQSAAVFSEQHDPKPVGTQKVLVIPVDFPDESATVPLKNFEETLNGMDEYLREASYGKANLEGEVVDRWVRLPNPTEHYGRDSERPGDDRGGNGRGSIQIVYDTVEQTDRQIDYSKYTHLILVHAGDDQAEAEPDALNDLIWSYSYWDISIPTDDGVQITHVSIVSEKSTLGVWIHEYLHQLAGLPDLWDTEGGDDHYIGVWSPMDLGVNLGVPRGSSPPHPIAWSKIRMEWLEPLTLAENDSTVTLAPLEQLTGTFTQAVVVPLPDGTSYIIEARERIGFDASLPAEGVLIYHVKEMGDKTEVHIVPRQDGDRLKRSAAYRTGDTFFEEIYNLYIEIGSKNIHGYEVSITFDQERDLTLEVPNRVAALQPFIATVKILTPKVDPKINLFLDEVLHKTASGAIDGEYRLTLQLGLDQIGDHVIRVILVDPEQGTRSEVARRVSVEAPDALITIIGVAAFAVVLAVIALAVRRYRRAASTV